MPNKKYPDIHIGDKFGKWTVIEEVSRNKYGERMWKCKCECGNISLVKGNNLKNGKSTQCRSCRSRNGGLKNRGVRKKNEFLVSGDVVYVKLSNSDKVMICDKDVWEDAKQYTWFKSNNGYATSNIENKHTLFHTRYFKTDPNLVLDHIDRNKLNNRRENIREVTSMINNRNVGLRKNNKTGYTGVLFCKQKNKYRVAIYVNGKNIHIGYFDTPEEAYAARLKAEKEYWK